MPNFAISRQALYDEIWHISAAKTAKKYGINYSRFLKLCKENNIPTPPSGYWTKVELGKPAEKIPLPKSNIEVIPFVDDVNQTMTRETAQSPRVDGVAITDDEKIPLVVFGNSNASKSPYDRETLYKEVWGESVTKVAQKYHISDNGLRKVCKAMDIPLPDRGYWAKLKAGKAVDTPPKLPKLKKPKDENKPKTGDIRTLQIGENALVFLKDEDRKTVLTAAEKLRVAGPGAQLHRDIAAHKEKCERWLERRKVGSNSYGRYVEEPPFMAGLISKPSYPRAFHILDALLKAILPFGGGMNYDFKFRVNGEIVPFSMSEGKDEIPHEVTQTEKMALLKYEEEKKKYSYASKPKIPKYEHPWNGNLSITIGAYKFRDCKAYRLEDRIGEILVALYEASYPIRLKRLEAEENARKEAEARRRAEELREQYNIEIERTQGLVNAAEDYDTAQKIRSYVAALETHPDGERTPEWIQWARDKADWFDPTIDREDPYLGKRKHTVSPEHKKLEKKYGW